MRHIRLSARHLGSIFFIRFALVTLFGLIEHLPKTSGLALLDRVEKLSAKYILLETPHGGLMRLVDSGAQTPGRWSVPRAPTHQLTQRPE